MDPSVCFICGENLNDGRKLVTVTRGLQSLINASEKRNDGKSEHLSSKSSVVVHVDCRKEYTRLSSIEAITRQRLQGTSSTSDFESRKESLRSALPEFSFRRDCLFCGKEASIDKEKKKEVRYRRPIYLVTLETFENVVKSRSEERQDDWGRIVNARIAGVHDLMSVEARYHRDCYRQFFAPVRATTRIGRSEDPTKGEAFKNLRAFMENNDECQFSLDDLVSRMEAGSPSSSQAYGRQYLKGKLKDHYGDAILITDILGKSSIVNFKGRADELLQEKWYSDREASMASERIRIVETAAKIVQEDIRRTVYDCENYPTADPSVLSKSDIPESLQVFLASVISSRRAPNSESIIRKRLAIGEAIVSASRPRSYVPPLLLGLGVYVHRHYASKQLIQLLGSFGFSVPMNEVRRYEYSVIKAERPAANRNQYTQFSFDNADFNIRTLDGKNTFHCMGGIMCTSPASNLDALIIPRVREVPPASEIASMGKFDIFWYRKPPQSGLKEIAIREVRPESVESAFSASVVDALWLCGKWAGVKAPPSWNGYMKAASSSANHRPNVHITNIEALPFINLEPSNPSTIYSALKFAAAHCAKTGQKICFVTFDQPLYAKGAEILASDKSGELDNVIVRLGGFHLLMSFLGAIGYMMSGSGIEELWMEVYAKLTVPHMMSGHAYSRSLRAHFLTQQAIFTLIAEDLSLPSNTEEELRDLFQKFLDHTATVDDVLTSEPLKALSSEIERLSSLFSDKSRTGKLWIEYFRQVGIVRLFIRAERCGNWDLHLLCVKKMLPLLHAAGHLNYAKSAHLYVQQMDDLSSRLPLLEFINFAEEGYFTIRRSREFWSGTWSDMAIEQNLMRAMKVKGGLTHGRGLTDSVLAQWILSGPGCIQLCDALEQLSGVSSSSSEQHVELRDSRRVRDERDLDIFLGWLRLHSPFKVVSSLQSLSSGIEADETINCDRAIGIGENLLKSVVGGTFGDLTLKRSLRVKPLANMTTGMKVRDDVVPVNPMQLFLRIVCVMKTENDLTTYMKYELAPKPPALFDEVSLRKNVKSSLATVFESSEATNERFEAGTTKVVLDGGYLLHAVPWKRPTTYGEICRGYVSFVSSKFSDETTVVFDGYKEVTTKGEERRRRTGAKLSANISVSPNVVATSDQPDFLSNNHNKEELIHLLKKNLETAGHKTIQCPADADETIASVALEMDVGQDVVVVSRDTDVLVMVLARAKRESRIKVLHPSTSKSNGKLFEVSAVQKEIGNMKRCLLFCHAFTGCDATSALFGKGKKQAWNKLQKSQTLRNDVSIFARPNASKASVIAAGEKFAIALYDSDHTSNCSTLDELRVIKYSRKIAVQPVTASFQLATLPPTSAACAQHSLRVYLQVQDWLGIQLNPQEFGWKKVHNSLIPVTTTLPPAPENLLNLVSCNCKSACGRNCDCVRAGLQCTLMCGQCRGSACLNSTYDGSDEEDD